MTLVRIFRVRPVQTGEAPASGKMKFTPTRKRVVIGDPDKEIMPRGFTITVPESSGRIDVELAATGPGWAWQVHESCFLGILDSETEYVLVPPPEPDPDNPGQFLPVDFPELSRVDPSTLEPVEEPEAAWWAEVASAKAMASDVQEARDEAVAAKDEAVDARDIAVAAADAVGSAGYSATISPEYDHALRIFYSAALSPRPFVVRIPIGESL